MRIEDAIKQPRFRSPFQRLSINLVYTGNWLNTLQTGWLKPYGLTPQQFNVLRILRGQQGKPATVNLIRERMLDKMSNVSRLVEKLRAKGLLERQECPDDRRAVDVMITQQGLDLLETLDAHEAEWSARLRNLSAEEAETLSRLLDKLRG